MEYRGVADVLTAEERLRERREGAVIVTVVQSGLAEVATATRLVIREDGAVEGTFGIASETKLVADALERLGTGRSGLGSYDMVDGCLEAAPLQRGHLDVFFEVLSRPPELVIVGAGHIAVPLARIGALLGFDVVVLDDRPEYASRERFPDAHRIVVGEYERCMESIEIHSGSYIVLVTRGHVHDRACLERVLEHPAAYIGMIGSRRRVRRVLDAIRGSRGTLPERRIHAPIGLDIGAQTPAEIAIAIMGEIIGVRRGREISSLSQGSPRA